MSDEGLTNLEDDGPAITPDAPEPEPATEPATEEAETPAEQADKPAEVEAVEVGGQKYVPVAALKAEREKRQQLAPLAQRAQELEAWANTNRPYIEFLQANPDFLKQPQRAPEAPKAPAEPTVDPDALELARSLDLYDATGNPDVARAAKIQAVMAQTAQRQAQQLVQPFQEQQIQARAGQNYTFLSNLKHPDGTKVDQRVVDFVWNQAVKEPGGLKTLANEQSVASIALMVMGADSMWRKSQPAPAEKPAPPLVTEASGGNPRTRPAMSDLESRVAKERGVSPTQWSDTLRGFKPGATNVLED